MEQTNMVMAMYQAMAVQNMVPKTGKSGEKATDDFQKLLDQKAQPVKSDAPIEEKPQAEAAPDQKEEGIVQDEEDPIEISKKLQVYLTALSPEELSQYPAEWLPDNLEEGEPIVCIGVHTGKNGEQIPTLVGAKTAEKMYGKPVVVPEKPIDVSDPEADAMLEATDPKVDHSPARLLEKVTDEQFGKVVKQVVEEAAPQVVQKKEGEEQQVEIVEVDQGPQQLFHDVKAAPVKVGEVYDVRQAEEPDVAAQIDTGMAQALQTGETMVRIQLTPENLGQVTVEISQNADGVLRVALTAHSSETRGLLERHAGDLQGLLASRTQQSIEVSVQRQAESQQDQNQQHNYDGHNGHAQNGQEHRRQHREHTSPEDFMQQLRLGLIPSDEEF